MRSFLTSILVLIEFIPVFGVIFILIWAPMAKLVLGSVLTFLGAFFPSNILQNNLNGKEVNKLNVTAKKFKINIVGSLRFAVICAGIVILLITAKESFDGKQISEVDLETDTVSEEAMKIMFARFAYAVFKDDFNNDFLKPYEIASKPKLYAELFEKKCSKTEIESAVLFETMLRRGTVCKLFQYVLKNPNGPIPDKFALRKEAARALR